MEREVHRHSPQDLIQFARGGGGTAEHTHGKCTIIIGAGVNHWYHANLMYRAGIHALLFCGCVGVNGGGLAHYVGQEKLAPQEPWSAMAFAKDWNGGARLQNAPSWHYVHSDQWRYEREFTDYHTVPAGQPEDSLARGHTMDAQVRAVRNGWLPFYPQFDRPRCASQKAQAAGARRRRHREERDRAPRLATSSSLWRPGCTLSRPRSGSSGGATP
ncbi:MAG: molybdopterin-dependent oxidoreductase [Planctomycetes bacterium]|nr:molybdopterin-dependent oxidoreductase [Planctomycetota bacterium]